MSSRATKQRIAALASIVGIVIAGQAVPVRANHEGRTLQVTPEMDRNAIGTTHKMTARIDPPAGDEGSVLIDWKITSGPNAKSQDPAQNVLTAPDFTCTIPAGSSTCSIEYTDVKAFAGTDNIVVWIDHDGDNATVEADLAETHNAGGPPNEPGCPELRCGPPDDSGAGNQTEPDSTDVVLKEWGQLKTAALPYRDGDTLAFIDQGCETQKSEVDGKVTAVTKACLSLYAVPPLLELDEVRNHGALWLQSSVDARSGWCATRVVTKLTLPQGAEFLGITPNGSKPTARKKVNAKLRVGNLEIMTSVPSLLQSFFAYPDVIRVRQSEDGDVAKLVWSGRTRTDLAFALGAWISYPTGTNISTLDVGARVERALTERARC
jgi:hypothetical protein